CGDVIYNLTDSLYTSDILTCKSDCHGYIDDTPKMSYKKRRNPLERGNPEPKDTCKSVGFGGECGTKPTIFKCNGLSWDCGKEGFKYQTCSEIKIKTEYLPYGPRTRNGHIYDNQFLLPVQEASTRRDDYDLDI
ncbi:6916_t:CDS:2, partial [Scutellospora calospora]